MKSYCIEIVTRSGMMMKHFRLLVCYAQRNERNASVAYEGKLEALMLSKCGIGEVWPGAA
jgi:hypothetical protein